MVNVAAYLDIALCDVLYSVSIDIKKHGPYLHRNLFEAAGELSGRC